MRRDVILETVFANSREPAYVMDPEHSRILAANEAGCALLGYAREELLETPISRIHPAELTELSELLERVLEHGRASTIKLTCRTKAGRSSRPRSRCTRSKSMGKSASSVSCKTEASIASARPATDAAHRGH